MSGEEASISNEGLAAEFTRVFRHEPWIRRHGPEIAYVSMSSYSDYDATGELDLVVVEWPETAFRVGTAMRVLAHFGRGSGAGFDLLNVVAALQNEGATLPMPRDCRCGNMGSWLNVLVGTVDGRQAYWPRCISCEGAVSPAYIPSLTAESVTSTQATPSTMP